MLQNDSWLEIRTCLRVKPEVQGGQVHHRAGTHDQGEWLGLTTRPRGGGGRRCAGAATCVIVGPLLPRGGPSPQRPPASTVLPAVLRSGTALAR
ncbi:hypothetical protein V5799_003773 [Amblyomma americanum]|uniref:Uncharacterized protein n=1 Tax=Amblyomma americanum TaxID=6943 RepID=A0AAQ4D803_AMBAM